MFAHRFLGGCSSSLSVSCPSLVSTMIAAACTLLWSSFRWCSEAPLLEHSETMVSCLLGRSRLFPRLPPCKLWRTSPLQAVFTQPTPVYSLGSELQTQSLSSQPPPAPAAEQTSLSGWWVLLGSHPLCGNLSALPSAPLLLHSSPCL